MARVGSNTRRRLARAERRGQKALVRQSERNSTPFRYDASLRISGVGDQHDDIAKQTGIIPTHAHIKGEVHGRFTKRAYPDDLWILSSPLGESATMDAHLIWLRNTIQPHYAYFEKLIAQASSADVCLGCLSDSPYPFWEVQPASLDLLRELKLGFTFNFTCT